jgi:hypothetical protein
MYYAQGSRGASCRPGWSRRNLPSCGTCRRQALPLHSSNVLSNCIETEKTPRNPSARFRRPRGACKDDGKSGRLAIYEEASDAHVDEGNAAHVSASLAVAFGRHAAAIDSNVLSYCIKTEKTPRNPSARFRRPRGAWKDECKTNAFQAKQSGHLRVKPVMAETNGLSNIRAIRQTLQCSFLLLLQHRVDRKYKSSVSRSFPQTTVTGVLKPRQQFNN